MKIFEHLFSRNPVPKTEDEMASLIEGVANGACGRWDYFISTHFEKRKNQLGSERILQG
jgi:hypothetical protein